MTPRNVVMASINVYGIDSIDARRTDDEEGSLQLVIVTDDGTRINIGAGRFYDDAETLHVMLSKAADAMRDVLTDWRDVPDYEGDGFVSEDRGRYYVTLSGSSWDSNGLFSARSYPTRDIATYELACAMSDSGYFPNEWFQGERGWTDDIGEAVRSYHDEGGDGIRPLVGVQYDDGDEVVATIYHADNTTGTHSAYVIRDYGTLGIVYVLSGDDEERFTDDRDTITTAPDDDEEVTA